MPDEIAFLRTILEQPHDDAPRLVFADWLEEHGDTARAEFIRVQIELARLGPDDPRRVALATRERELLDRHAREWIAALGDWVREAHFRRGLIESAQVEAVDFVSQGMRLFERAPVQRLRLSDATHHLAAIAAAPALRILRGLDLSDNRLEVLDPLLDSPALAHLEFLDLGLNPLGTAGLTALARSPNLRRLRTLKLYSIRLGRDSLWALGVANWPELTDLDLNRNELGGNDPEILTRAPFACGLRRLSLQFNRFTALGAAALARSPHLAQLTMLQLSNNLIGNEGAIAIASAPTLAALEELNLESNQIGRRGARALASSRHLADLRHLNLSGNRLNREDVRELKRRFGERVTCSAAPRIA